MVEIKDLVFSYRRDGKPLFDGLSLKLESGNIYGLLGKNGAGKTTLLKVISGLLFKGKGEVTVLGKDPAGRSPGLLSKIFFLPEEFYLPPVRGIDYVRLYRPFYPAFKPELFESYARELEVDTTGRLGSLSYGQKKKFLIAFGLASGCSIVVLDEPTNGLDIPSKRQFRKLISGMIGESGEIGKDQIFIISTHQVRDLEHLIDPIIILDSGRIILNESLEELSKHFSMSIEKEEPETWKAGSGDVLYWEKVLGGYAVIRKGPSEGRELDIEVLFNALVSMTDRLEAENVIAGGAK